MLKHREFTAALLAALALVLSACNAPVAPTADSNAVITRAAGTAAARLTEAAALQPSPTASVTLAPTGTPVPPTATGEATAAGEASPATSTPAPTATSAPVSGAAPDSATYVADVDYPDNAPVSPGEVFTKTWRIKNNGTTTWTTGYSLVCIDPGKFQCPDAVSMPIEVKSGETVDIQVRLTAPTQAGTQRAYFRLRNAAGQFFKLDGTGDLWVQVLVGDPSAAPKPGSPTNTPEATATSTPEPSPTP